MFNGKQLRNFTGTASAASGIGARSANYTFVYYSCRLAKTAHSHTLLFYDIIKYYYLHLPISCFCLNRIISYARPFLFRLVFDKFQLTHCAPQALSATMNNGDL